MEYKIGDVVRIKDDLQAGKKYGGCVALIGMLKFRGKIDTIEDIDRDGDFYLSDNDNAYVWHKDMVEPVTMKDDLKEPIRVDEIKGGNSMGYKIGDVVRIKDNLQEGEVYGKCDVTEGMLSFRGTLDFIENIDEDGDYYLANNNNSYIWSKDMLESFASPEGVTLTSNLKSVKMDRLGIYEYILNHLEETYRDTNDNDQDNTIVDIYDKFGDTSFLIRILERYNELSRLCNPNAPEQRVKDEKIDDTILDLANYCLLWLVEREYRNQ